MEPAVSVAFLDLCGFTAFTRVAGDVGARTVARQLHECVRRSLAPTVRLVKTLGDGVLLVGDDARELANTNRSIFAAWQKVGALPLRGIAHRGPVVWGEDGDVYGDVVNTAAHLLDRVPTGTCVGTSTYERGVT